ncbi:hypothetical protein KP509_22G045600 [Ceratopteris richardii]|uniref:Malectin-like domain-containing protein n=1 Tax=Ceratopteris richardii TaxID=49495 RepID=A0A8T2S7S7_CERRI|nr:hypothetical protein KP509_22G045600 [Ceratopteris richardii]
MMDVKRYLSSQWIPIILCGLSVCCMQTEAQAGFTSIDCGGTANYSDVNGISWIPDSYMGAISSEGDAKYVDPPPYTTDPTPLSTIRYFPGNHSKYCYVFTSEHGVQKDSAYLVRASFWAGSAVPYTTQVPNRVTFDLLIYTDLWDEMNISLPQIDREDFREIDILAIRDSIEVCLVGKSTGTDIPFISSLVLRPLDSDLKYVDHMVQWTGKRPLLSAYRINYGAPSAQTYIR